MLPVHPFSFAAATAVIVWGLAVYFGFKEGLTKGAVIYKPSLAAVIIFGVLRGFGGPYTAYSIVDMAFFHFALGCLAGLFMLHQVQKMVRDGVIKIGSEERH